MGRIPTLTPSIHDKLVAALEDGNAQVHAYEALGVKKDTYFQWLRKGREERARREAGEAPTRQLDRYVNFANAVDAARAKAAQMYMGVVKKRSLGGHVLSKTSITRTDPATGETVTEEKVTYADVDAKPAIWFLERGFPKLYGPPSQRIEHTGVVDDDGTPQPIEVAVSAKDALLHRLAMSAERVRSGDGDDESTG